MKRAALMILLLGGVFGAWAIPVAPTATLTLDTTPPQPQQCFFPGVECFDYTLTVTNGIIGDIGSVTINNVGGLFPIDVDFIGWDTSINGSSVTFTNPGGLHNPQESLTKLDGFLIESSDTATVPGTYSYTLGLADPGGSVPVPGVATPEPASMGFLGLGLVALVGLRKRFASR